MSKTIGLYIIVKDEVKEVEALIQAAQPYFDRIYITSTYKPSYKAFKKLEKGNVHVSRFEWNDRFDDARNFNFAQGNTDYGMWIDADDSFEFQTVPKILEKAIEQEVDAVWLPYEYAHDEDGNCIVLHWRERIINLHKPFFWKGWVHENFICEEPFKSERVNVPVVHNNTHHNQSHQRNHEILEKAYRETKDPRYIHYLGISYYSMEDWEACIEVLKEYIEVGGWDEEIYRSLIRMSEASNNLGKTEDALQYCLRAIGLLPEYPQAYFNLAQLEFEGGNHKQCLEWLKVAFSKPEPESASITDPTMKDRARLMGALSEFKLGNHREALGLLEGVETLDVSDIRPDFAYEASVDRLAAILPALLKHYTEPSLLWENLSPNLKYDNRFRKLRELLTEPTTWEENTVAIFCGKGFEEWGPHTVDMGMGGSEEAIVNLSRELQRQGLKVTVYGEVPKPMDVDGVKWFPWTHIDKRDTFNTLVIWRYPQFVPQFKAKHTLVDMHDLLPVEALKPYKNTTYMFKSKYHATHYPQIKDYRVVGNGINKSDFSLIKKKKNSIGYFSAYYRGLECLVDMWPLIKAEVPEATLDVYYGWQSWLALEGENDFYKRMSAKLEAAKKLGVTEHGRVGHKELAQKMAETQVWAYPTQFKEIHCITALKAQEAQCYPVTTDVAALAETVQSGTKIETERIYSDEYSKEKFIKAVVTALKEGKNGEPVEGVDWQDVAKEWKDTIDGKNRNNKV